MIVDAIADVPYVLGVRGGLPTILQENVSFDTRDRDGLLPRDVRENYMELALRHDVLI